MDIEPRHRPTGLSSSRLTPAQVGQRGEALTADYLAGRGFVILGRNVRVGRLEIDVIAQRDDLVVFVEVRARSNRRTAEPFESIDRGKVQRLRRAAARWLEQWPARGQAMVNVRFDVASVVLDGDAAAKHPANGEIQYFEDAF